MQQQPHSPLALPPLPFDMVCSEHDDRKAWLKARSLTIGASEVSAVFGESPWTSLLELWSAKTGRMPQKELDDKEAVFWGRHLEPSIINGYGAWTKRAVVPFGILLRSTRYPILSATPDALCTDDPEAAKNTLKLQLLLSNIRSALREGEREDLQTFAHQLAELSKGWWPLQIKNIGFGSAEHWVTGVPLYYRIQCAAEAIVWGSDRCTGAALIAGQKLAWEDIDRDDAQLSVRIPNLTRRFWDQNIALGVQPPPDASDSARNALAALYPKERPELTLQLGTHEMELARERDAIKDRAKGEDKRLKQIENELKAAIGHATECIFPDGTGFTLKTTHKPAFTVEACSYRVLLRKKPKKEKGE